MASTFGHFTSCLSPSLPTGSPYGFPADLPKILMEDAAGASPTYVHGSSRHLYQYANAFPAA